ncbi:MAG TPA: ATP phosphoribosyltransferase regulatory subunit, partial [Acidimicrobiales bacterium]|nr:ATP phosphoribosyltransferase regulatory subunit [Acidimicrobiales bacterium]
PLLDVEIVGLAWRFFEALGLRQVRLDLNTLGDHLCRPAFRQALLAYLEPRADTLCPEHRERWRVNPLRVLDCKRDPCRAATAEAPIQLDHLCAPCREHWTSVREGLDALGIPYRVQPRLVRGLDYYTRTAFEYGAEALHAAQDALGGGGRYDGLVAALGGPPTPGIGFSLGIERILLACDAEGVFPPPGQHVAAFVVDLTDGRGALELTHQLRSAGVRADRAFDRRSLRAQLRQADRAGAQVALILGPDEAAAGTVTLRPLRGEGDQETLDRGKVVERVRDLVAGGGGEEVNRERT